MKVRLFSAHENRQNIVDILATNNIEVSDDAEIAVIEEGVSDDTDFSVKVIYKADRIGELKSFIRLLSDDFSSNDIILGKQNEAYIPLKISDISYFNGINNDTFANTDSGERYLIKKKLYQLEEELFAAGFFRINKSELVNMKKITLITPMFKGKLIIYLSGYKAPFDISRGYTKAFKERLGF